MRSRTLFRAVDWAVLLALAAGPGLIRGWQGGQASEPEAATGSPGANAEWIVDELDTGGVTGQYASVAYHPDLGIILISYYDATNERLRLARSGSFGPGNCGLGGGWYCITLDSGPDVGKYSSIAVNPADGSFGITYYDATNGSLKYIVWPDPHVWVHNIYTIDKGIPPVSKTGLYTSLAYSEDGKPHIAYYFENTSPGGVDALMLAYYTVTNGDCGYGPMENKWRCHTIWSGEGVGQYPSLVATTAPWGWAWYISFYDGGRGELWYAKPAMETTGNCGIYGDDMACYGVAGGNDVGRYSSLYLDSADRFHIAYYDATDEQLMYAVELASGPPGNCGVLGSAQCDEIDAMPANYHPLGISLDEDPAGRPVIAYQGEYQDLKLARPLTALGLPGGAGNCGPEELFLLWFCDTIDPYWPWSPGGARQGDFVSLDVDPSGLAYIAYQGFIKSESSNLRVAYQRFRVYLPLILRQH
jgi:hypothetical protein